jgi:alpha-beta hydrolase superfamily lysophospholipase
VRLTGFVVEPWHVADGLRGYRWRARDPHASLLLQHGYAEYAERYVEHHHQLIPNFIDAGFDVYAFDMRGHGRSTGVRGAVDVERAVEDHQAARRILQHVGKPLFLFGHSLGGLVTAASVARDQHYVAGVVLSAPALLLNVHPVLARLAGGLASIAPTLRVLPPQPAAGISRDAEETRLFGQDPQIYHGRMPVLTGTSALAVARQTWPGYRDWQVPTLTLHGTADTYTDIKGSALFHALIRPPTKEFATFEGGRHELLNDLDRHRALAVIIAWLQRRICFSGASV